jgi:hypothetical protein
MVVWQPRIRRWTHHTDNVAGSSDVSSKNEATRELDNSNHCVQLGIRSVREQLSVQCKSTSEQLMMWERYPLH